MGTNYFVNGEPTTFNILLKALPTKGHIAWEYNPFRNYRLDEDLYEYDGYYYNLWQLNDKFGILLKCKISINNKDGLYYEVTTLGDFTEDVIKQNSEHLKFAFDFEHGWYKDLLLQAIHKAKPDTWYGVPNTNTDPQLREKGELVDFITDELQFNLNHPVDILPQNSYDDSVNLIINDGFSYPKIINSRFSPRGKNTYEIVDRKGNSDTNIYDRGDLFKTDTSLYKIINTFPKLEFKKVTNGGALKVGNYFFYFRLSDSDGNETDFFEESGLVSIFKGDSNYRSISTGLRDENSFKCVHFSLTDLDSSYSYVYVYYSRSSAEGLENQYINYVKIDLKYQITNNGEALILITGFEPTIEISAEDINLTYDLLDAAETQASCLNRLFLANVTKPNIPYLELTDLSLRFIPRASMDDYDVLLTEKYQVQSKETGYINPLYIYNKTGYWNNEYYRFGIVYIMKNGELSPVFNVRGGYNIDSSSQFSEIDLYTEDEERVYIEYDETNYNIINAKTQGQVLSENVKGVIRLNNELDNNKIHYIKFDTSPDVIQELKKYVKGFFFVRLHRIPTILALGIVIGVDKTGRVPTIPTIYDNIDTQIKDIDKTHIDSDNLNGLLYISEGFLERYKFKFESTGSGIWKTLGKIALATVAIAATVVATAFTFGASAVVLGAIIATGLAVTAAVGTVGAIAGAIHETTLALTRTVVKKKYKGRETKAPSGYKIVEDSDSRRLVLDFESRLIYKDPDDNVNRAILCPEYSINQGYLNSIFTGNEHYIKTSKTQSPICTLNVVGDEVTETKIRYFDHLQRHFFIKQYTDCNETDRKSTITNIVGLTSDLSVVSVGEELYRARAGEAEEAWKYLPISSDHLIDTDNIYSSSNLENKKINSDIVRGNYGPYLAMNTDEFGPCETVDIYVPGYDPSNYTEYMKLRMNDYSSYKAVTERIDITNLDSYQPDKTLLVGDDDGNYVFPVFRGDCYICQFTHRLNRNFNSPSSPYNDEIIDENCWRDGYKPSETSDYSEINLGDVNAILLGMWLTFRVRSTFNLNIPTIDESNISELLMSGHPRSRYPLSPMSVEGSYKIPDSLIFNKGFGVSLGERYNIEVPDVPYLKQWYGTRIMYSDLATTDSFKNGFRLFWSTNHQDYAVDYGSITKLITLEGSLLCVFEHGIALIPVNERTAAGEGVGGTVYINTSNVLPLNPMMISDTIGSLWKDSVIKTERGIVYGVDTVAKKIWMYAGGNEIKCISDMSVLKFLNDNISLSERELDPIIGIRNVKTHYNSFKHDIMFTFYDNIYDFEEKVWNLCWNELLNQWVTFYSWVPSYSENIYNQYFSFDRNTSKYIAKLGVSKADNDFSDGVVLSENILSLEKSIYKTISQDGKRYDACLVGVLDLKNRTLPEGDNIRYTINYTLERDIWKNYLNFIILQTDSKGNPSSKGEFLSLFYIGKLEDLRTELYLRYYIENGKKIELKDPLGADYDAYKSHYTYPLKNDIGIKINLENQKNPFKPVIYLNIKAHINVSTDSEDKTYAEAYASGFNNRIELDAGYYKSMVALTLDYNLQFLTTDFWKHGLSGIIDIKDPITPCYWYGKLHPFEFEFIVRDSEWNHKIFNNLLLLSNKAEPESFHFEVVGECYDFAENKKNMYIRQEATKELYLYNGTDIIYDHNYKTLKDITPPLITSGNCYSKSTIFPLYYYRQDTINEIEDSYHKRNGSDTKNYSQMAGAEIMYDDDLQEYRVVNHVPAINMKGWNNKNGYREQIGRIRGNMEYKEDFWNIQINPINVVYNNESIRDCLPYGETEGYLTPIVYNLFKEFDSEYYTAIYGKDELKEISHETINVPNDFERNIIWWGDMENQNSEVRIKDKYLKVRVRYSGKDLAIITAIRTLYTISFS